MAAVGDRERVIAGVDCGFGTFVGWEWVTEDVAWAKLAVLRAGAEIASNGYGAGRRPEPILRVGLHSPRPAIGLDTRAASVGIVG